MIAAKTEEARAAQAALVARQSALEAARADKRSLLANVSEERHHDEENLDELQAASAQLAAQMNQRLAPNATIAGSVREVRIAGVYTTPTAFVVRVVMDGAARLSVQ